MVQIHFKLKHNDKMVKIKDFSEETANSFFGVNKVTSKRTTQLIHFLLEPLKM
jgi:hypothetical protein